MCIVRLALLVMAASGYLAPRPMKAQASASSAYGASVVVDVTRAGEGSLRDSQGTDHQFDRARLVLDGGGEFQLVIYADSTYEFAGTWSGDLRFAPISLDVRAASGRRAQGTGHAWVRDRSWDRNRSFDRVELDIWKGSEELGLYFDTESRLVDR